MARRIVEGFYRVVLRHPVWVAIAVLVLLAGAVHQARHFELDASSESLMLEGDADLEAYRDVRDRYGSDDVLFITYRPREPLFSEESLDTVAALSEDLRALERVESVTTLLNVPLVEAADASFSSLQADIPTLADGDVSVEAAREELQNSPLYDDLLVNDAGDTTALLVRMARDEPYRELLDRRRALQERRAASGLSPAERGELRQLVQEATDTASA